MITDITSPSPIVDSSENKEATHILVLQVFLHDEIFMSYYREVKLC